MALWRGRDDWSSSLCAPSAWPSVRLSERQLWVLHPATPARRARPSYSRLAQRRRRRRGPTRHASVGSRMKPSRAPLLVFRAALDAPRSTTGGAVGVPKPKSSRPATAEVCAEWDMTDGQVPRRQTPERRARSARVAGARGRDARRARYGGGSAGRCEVVDSCVGSSC